MMLTIVSRVVLLSVLTLVCTLSYTMSYASPKKPVKLTKAKASGIPFAKRKEVQKFIQTMHKKHGLNKKNLTTLFNEFNTEPKVLALMSRQYEALPWYKYQNTIVTEKRVKEGVQFWKKHQILLKEAEKKFGVPAEIIVAILGIETSYGQITGNYPVLQTLATLAFDYPRRAPFFKAELEHFLLLVNEGALHPLSTRGSYAGAMGIPQFMPSSYRRYAIDFSGTGKRDLIHDTADVIGSVANYLKANGWKPNEKIVLKAIVQGTQYKNLAKYSDLKPILTLNELLAYNVKPTQNMDTLQKGKFIMLEKNANNTKEHWIGLHNFYVITRYNRSIHYAMAVYQLSQKIRALKKDRTL